MKYKRQRQSNQKNFREELTSWAVTGHCLASACVRKREERFLSSPGLLETFGPLRWLVSEN